MPAAFSTASWFSIHEKLELAVKQAPMLYFAEYNKSERKSIY
jgi:hypothetical protein